MKNSKKTVGGQSGFTFIEVLIAMVILTLGLLAVASMLTQGMAILAGTPAQLAAKELAGAIIDNIAVQSDAGTLGNLNVGTTSEKGRQWNGMRFDVTTNYRVDTDGNFVVEVIVEYQVGAAQRRYTTTSIIN